MPYESDNLVVVRHEHVIRIRQLALSSPYQMYWNSSDGTCQRGAGLCADGLREQAAAWPCIQPVLLRSLQPKCGLTAQHRVEHRALLLFRLRA